MIKYVLFDLDGTLLSTLETITYHLNATISGLSLGEVSVEDTRQFIGNGAGKLVARVPSAFFTVATMGSKRSCVCSPQGS